MNNENEELAVMLVKAIKELVSKPDNLENFESYLSRHFDTWMEKYANTPYGLANELKTFAEIGHMMFVKKENFNETEHINERKREWR